MKKLNKILVFIMLLCCFMGCGFSAPLTTISTDIVLEELQGSTIEGQAFDITKYKKNENGQPKVITFAERGYSSQNANDYSLEIYLYNPTCEVIQEDNCFVQMSVGSGKHTKYDIEPIGSSQGNYANLFYKFRLKNVASIYVALPKADRTYSVSGIEFALANDNVCDYAVSLEYVYNGEGETLSCTSSKIETISLDVTPVTYKYNNGISKQSILNSVYFGIDNTYFDRFDKLQKIHAQWIKAHTSDMVITNDSDVYNEFYNYIGKALSQMDESKHPSWCVYQQMSDYAFTWGYNISSSWGTVYEIMDKLTYLFKVTDDDYHISSEDILAYMTWYTLNYGSDKNVAGKYSSDLFSFVEDLTDVNIDADSNFSIDGFDSGSGIGDWWYSFLYPDLETSGISDIKPIYIVQASDLVGSDEEVASRLLMSVEEVSGFKTAFANNVVEKKSTILFRFAVGEYKAVDVMTLEEGLFNTAQSDLSDKVSFDTYLNFDIIDLTFEKEGLQTVIPVVQTPEDVVPDVDPPLVEDPIESIVQAVTNWWENIPVWVWVVGIIIALLVLAFLVKPVAELILFILKVVVFIVAAPFKGVAWLFKKILKKG